jgi:hypothetical protein
MQASIPPYNHQIWGWLKEILRSSFTPSSETALYLEQLAPTISFFFQSGKDINYTTSPVKPSHKTNIEGIIPSP